ncbi:MAG: hypothetical protein FWE19_00375 [Oscillospiraceae bacterium]|nr:hypothetical protein [Oscillospiraceae bacterium]
MNTSLLLDLTIEYVDEMCNLCAVYLLCEDGKVVSIIPEQTSPLHGS